MLGNSRVGAQLVASQEVLSSMELVSQLELLQIVRLFGDVFSLVIVIQIEALIFTGFVDIVCYCVEAVSM
jgi:hypothetical protein